jgi:hypothetical protein
MLWIMLRIRLLTIEQRQRLVVLGDDLEQLWDDPRSPANLKKPFCAQYRRK